MSPTKEGAADERSIPIKRETPRLTPRAYSDGSIITEFYVFERLEVAKGKYQLSFQPIDGNYQVNDDGVVIAVVVAAEDAAAASMRGREMAEQLIELDL